MKREKKKYLVRVGVSWNTAELSRVDDFIVNKIRSFTT